MSETLSQDSLSIGTFKCDVCGLGTPHYHSPEEVEIERLIRPAFEKTIVPMGKFGFLRNGSGCTPYAFGRTENLWQHFIAGWVAAKEAYSLTTLDKGKP